MVAPDGSSVYYIINQSTYLTRVAQSPHPVQVVAGQTYTYSAYLKLVYESGSTASTICIDGTLFGGASDICVWFNIATGTFISMDTGIADYSIAADQGQPGWFRVSATVTATASGSANAYIGCPWGAACAAWGAQFVTGPYQGQYIPTTTAPANDVNQILPNQDSLSTPATWTGLPPGTSAVIGRGGAASPSAWSVPSTYQGIATVITLNSNQVWLSSAGCNTLYSYVQKAFHKYRYNYNTYILSLSPYAWLFVKGGLNINSGNLVTGIPNPPTLTVPALSQGVFDAGDYWVFWVTAYISSVSESLTPLEQLISANL